MTVNLKFYDMSDNEISLDKLTGGFNYGIVRKGVTVPPKAVYIKNVGDTDAQNVFIKGSPLAINESDAGSPEEWANQLKAANWKGFSFYADKGFTREKQLGNIPAGAYMQGLRELQERFPSAVNSKFTVPYMYSGRHSYINNTFILTRNDYANSGLLYHRQDLKGEYGNMKDVTVTYEFNSPYNTSKTASRNMLMLRRQGANGAGYLLIGKVYHDSTTTVNKARIFWELRIAGYGLSSTGGSPNYGSVIAYTEMHDYVPFGQVKARIFTNADNLPEIEVTYRGKKLRWGYPFPVKPTLASPYSWIDTANNYPTEGMVSIMTGTSTLGGRWEIRNVNIETPETKGKFYIKTFVGDDAEDGVIYKSSAEVFYDNI